MLENMVNFHRDVHANSELTPSAFFDATNERKLIVGFGRSAHTYR